MQLKGTLSHKNNITLNLVAFVASHIPTTRAEQVIEIGFPQKQWLWDSKASRTGVSNLLALGLYQSRLARNWATQQEVSLNVVSLNVMSLNHPAAIPLPPSLWKICLPWNQSLVLKSLGTAATENILKSFQWLQRLSFINSYSSTEYYFL